MKLGVCTHLNQGWPLTVLDEAKGLKAQHIRDAINWERMMPTPGVMNFADVREHYPDEVKAAAMPLFATSGFPMAHVDGKVTAFSPVGKHEYGDYILALLTRFPSLMRLEIGNEFNAGNFVSGYVKTLAPVDRARAYVELLAYLYPKVRPKFGQVQIIGGATHSIPIGYLRECAKNGMLKWCDAVAVHPYTSEPEQVGEHLELLRAIVGTKPIYATEFGLLTADPNAGAPYLMKMVAAMAAGGVSEASWYALRDETAFANMGLLTRDGTARKPAGEAFAFARAQMYQSVAVEIPQADRLSRMFKLGDRHFVAWGTGQGLTYKGRAYNALGALVTPTTLTADPVLIIADLPVTAPVITPTDLIGDSRWQFSVLGAGPWSWKELRGTGVLQNLVMMPGGERNGEPWIPYMGHPTLRPLQVNVATIRPADFSPVTAPVPGSRCTIVERFACSGDVRIEGDWTAPLAFDLTIKADGVTIWESVGTAATVNLTATVTAALEFFVGPSTNTGSLVTRRIRVFQE